MYRVSPPKHRTTRTNNDSTPLGLVLRICRLAMTIVGTVVCTTKLLSLILPEQQHHRSSSSTTNNKIESFRLGNYRGPQYTSRHGSDVDYNTIGTPRCLVESKWMKVMQHSVRIPGSRGADYIVNDWLWIDYHDRVNVLVEDERKSSMGKEERRFLVFEQSKYALEGRTSLAVIGGIIEPGESAEVAAMRELEEEMVDVRCDRLEFLGRFRTDVNRGMGWVNSFVAMDCIHQKIESNRSDLEHKEKEEEEVGAPDTERQDRISLSLSELRDAAREGKFLEVQWSNTVALALLHPESSTLESI